MSKTKISEFSTTPGDNTDINGINIAEGCAPSGINNAIRQMMSDLKEWQSGSMDVYVVPAGTAAAPGIQFYGDLDTGIYRAGANQLGITVGGVSVGYFDSTGWVGNIAATTLDATNIEVTNVKAKDGTAAFSIADTTGNVTFTSVLNASTFNSTTIDTTNIEVTNIKAKDGTAAVVLTDSTGAVGVSTALTASAAVTFSATSANIALGTSQTTGTFTVGGAAQTGAITVDQSTKTHTINIASGATENAATKTVNVATGGVSGSTTTITIGSENGTSTTVNGATSLNASDGSALFVGNSTASTSGSSYLTFKNKDGPGVYRNVARVSGKTTDNGGNGEMLFETYASGIAYKGLKIDNISGVSMYDTSGNVKLYWDSSNVRLGINKASPSTTLDVDGTISGTTVDTTNIEVTNVKAKDGTAAIVLTDSTGAVTVSTALTANGGAVFNENGANVDFRVEGDTDANLIFADASADAVGIGTNAPTEKVDVNGAIVSKAAATLSSGAGAYLYYTSGTSSAELTALNPSVAWLNQKYNALAHIWGISGTEKMRLTSTGTLNIVGAGTAGTSQAVSFNGSAPVNSLVLDSSGNLGLGVTPSAWAGNSKPLQAADASFWGSTSLTGYASIGGNYFYDGTYKYIKSSTATDYYQYQGAHAWRTAASGTAGNAITFSQVMTLDSSGNLGLGVTPSAWGSEFAAMQYGLSGAVASYKAGTAAEFMFVTSNAYNDNTNWRYIRDGAAARYDQNESVHKWFTSTSGSTGAIISSFTQAMTLDASGRLLNGTTSAVGKFTVFNAGTNDGAENAIAIMRFGTTYGSAIFHNYNSTLNRETLNLAVSDGTGTPANNTLTKYRMSADGVHIWYGATTATERARITSGGLFQVSSGGSVQVGGTAARATTAGTNRVDIFDGTAPVGTLANGVSFYSTAGEARVMDAAGNATLLSPHDTETNEWIFHSKHTPSGKVLRIDVERLLRFVNDHFGLDAVKEFVEE